MLSGSITIRSRKLPLVWTGEKAQHVAENYMLNDGIHVYLHVQAQQFARKGHPFPQGGKRYIAVSNAGGNNWIIVPLQYEGKFVLILSCFLEKNQPFDTLKKQKRIGSVAGKKSKKPKVSLTPPQDFQLSEGAIKATIDVGFDPEKVRRSLWLFANGIKPKK